VAYLTRVEPHPYFSFQFFSGRGPGNSMPAPLDRPSVRFYLRASNAIWNAVKLLGLSSDDSILLPSYHCGIELDAVLKADVRATFYSVGKDIKIDIEAIRGKIDSKTRAVFVTHYFGIPQELRPLRELCDRAGIFLIEDCAHGLFGRQGNLPLGTVGDFSVFSMWKMVPIPYGGALLVNRPDLPLPPEGLRPSRYEFLRVMKKLLEIRFKSSRMLDVWLRKPLMDPLSAAIRRANRLFSNDQWTKRPVDNPIFCAERGNWGIPPLSLRLLARVDPAQVVQRRRAHFETLLKTTEGVEGLKPLVPSLPEGACPLYFPVILEEAERFVTFMQGRGIAANRFWSEFHPAFPKEEYPETNFLKTRAVILPIHQDLTVDALDRLCDGIRQWGRKGTRNA